MKKENKNPLLWQNFANKNNLSDEQLEQFKKYYELIQDYNKQHNITAIEDLESIIRDHFQDSLALSHFIKESDNNIKSIADVGSGAGFPAIPLKIKFKDLKVTLIEVTNKKINFLRSVIKELNLNNIETCNLDWRTFLRQSESDIDLFCARASLPVKELLRALKPNCLYKNSTIIYWASKYWQNQNLDLLKRTDFISKIYDYELDLKKRKLIFFSKNSN